MIKVENVRVERLVKNLIGGNAVDVLVTDAKLLLIEDRNGEYISCLQANLPDTIGYRGFCKPIWISETEKSQNGDWVYNSDTKKIFIRDSSDYLDSVDYDFLFKILVLPEHNSPEILQMIVDGQLKDGDKKLIECENKVLQSGSGQINFTISENRIKLNSSNHIIFYDYEEKMIPISLLEKAFEAGRAIKEVSSNHVNGYTTKYVDVNDWLKQNNIEL